MVLFSGDGDFCSLLEALLRRGVRVTVVSTISTQPPWLPMSCGARLTTSLTQGYCNPVSRVIPLKYPPYEASRIGPKSIAGLGGCVPDRKAE
jgi:hypothetical protein